MTEARRPVCLDAGVARLPYDRSAVAPGVVHLGIGAFFRAHGAVYFDDILARDPSWGVIGVSLRRPDTKRALAPQDYLYTVAERSGAGTRCRVVGSVLKVLDATADRDETIAALTDPRIRIVSLTVTEKGYCHDPATGELDAGHPDIVHDLASLDVPVSAPGLIVLAIALRRAAGHPPFTVLCCDNLPSNGETAARVILGYAERLNRDIADYIRSRVAFPSTMVDRIVPATTEEDRALVLAETGFEDAWPVATEPFSQWVIEDRFSSGRPDLDSVGAQLVADVRDYELMKLRMLNGSHSTLAYLGYLAGHELVSQAIEDPAIHGLIRGLMFEEVMETLPEPLGDLSGYAEALLERFANPALKHRTWQIAMDGSQKLPQRLLGTIADRRAAGRRIDRLALGVAAWMRYVTGVDERGRAIDVRDPLSGKLRSIADAADGDPVRLVGGLLGVTEVFGTGLAHDETFRTALIGQVAKLFELGSIGAIGDLEQRLRA